MSDFRTSLRHVRRSLADATRAAASRCPGCRSSNPCGVYWAIEPDGPGCHRCLNCDHPRPGPGRPAGGYLRGFFAPWPSASAHNLSE